VKKPLNHWTVGVGSSDIECAAQNDEKAATYRKQERGDEPDEILHNALPTLPVKASFDLSARADRSFSCTNLLTSDPAVEAGGVTQRHDCLPVTRCYKVASGSRFLGFKLTRD
jgi:hypothetical protein